VKLFNLNKKKAQKFHEQGQALSDDGKDIEAIKAYLKAIELDPSKSESFYNIGLIYKYQGEWAKSLEYNAKAYELCPEDESARWNLAIAATALRKWEIARRAWSDNGIELVGESGPIDMNFGMTPVRLNPDDSGEVVWATRIDPVRAKIDSIPYKESGFKHGDVVLHDGAAVGYRKVGDKEYAVFNVLEMFEPSNYSTVVATVKISSDKDIEKLEEIFSETEHEFEDWTKNIRTICRQCSEGKPHESHDQELIDVWVSERTLGIAVCENSSIIDLFQDWQQKSEGKLLEIGE
jgi:hypothetical protein